MFRGRVAGWEAYWWHDGRGEILSAYYGIDDGCIRGIYVCIHSVNMPLVLSNANVFTNAKAWLFLRIADGPYQDSYGVQTCI